MRARSDSPTTSVLVAGVGGQGVLLISELLARAAIAAGRDAKQTEVHGVSQRGGSVYSHVRFGTAVHSPLIPMGQADLVVGLEKLEGLRFAPFARADGTVVINTHEVPPMSAGADAMARYPHDAAAVLRRQGRQVLEVAATELAESELGQARVANVVVLGLLSTLLPLPGEVWPDLLAEHVPARYLDLNRRAFMLGAALAPGVEPADAAGGPALSAGPPWLKGEPPDG